uniref:Ribosomal protein S18 n=1 Tax=Amphimedon queenslandica TaxID=400682 RepID=A0A1X7V7J4_AMPQE
LLVNNRLYALSRSNTDAYISNGVNDCPKSCLCSNGILIDYKNVQLLSQFVSSQTGMMYPRTYTKICMKKQKQLARAIKRSRTMGFMPYTYKIPEYLNDPKLF